jgi:hypothetical protein
MLTPKSGAKVGIKKAPQKWSAKTLQILRFLYDNATNSLHVVQIFYIYTVIRARQKSLGAR